MAGEQGVTSPVPQSTPLTPDAGAAVNNLFATARRITCTSIFVDNGRR